MKTTPIVRAPHQSLRTKAEPITHIDAKIRQNLESLGFTLKHTTNPQGVGLAAPQINKSLQVFATQLEHPRTGDLEIRLFLNPKITDQADKLVLGVNPRQPDLEGCLSIPYLYGPVNRPEWITITWQEMTDSEELSQWHTETFFDFPARVIQHELDHLHGILFTDHSLKQNQPLYREVNDDLELVEDPTFVLAY